MFLLTPAIASINARNPYHLDDNADVPMGMRQCLHQFWTRFDVMKQVFQCRLDIL
jgi:hypothetical protein